MPHLGLLGAGLAKPRILVVDDVMQNLQVVGTMLRNEGYDVMPAASGPQALERMRVRTPDLILLDLMMPEIDGLEVCRRLKADPETQQIPIIFLTASNEMEHLVKGFEVGAVDYVTKPFNGAELLARVRTHLELKLARERLREMNDEKNEFMGIVAHDLRNPLGAIQGYSEMIIDDREMSRAEIDACVSRILETARRMSDMVRNLLDTNRIERGDMKVSLTAVDLGPLAKKLTESYHPRAAAKQQNLCLQQDTGPLVALADPNQIIQVLENLISNAVKYSPHGKEILVRVGRADGMVRCEVTDQGPGLSAEDQKKLFGKFARLSAKPTGGEHATGLGLSIVKRMVEAMNGRVWCESEPGHGATFIVALPLAIQTPPLNS
jgi:two-component system sensor histidine kinase/response regulator